MNNGLCPRIRALVTVSPPFAVYWMTCCHPEFPLNDPPCILYSVALTHPHLLAMVRGSLHIISLFGDSQLITLPCGMNVRLCDCSWSVLIFLFVFFPDLVLFLGSACQIGPVLLL